MNILIIDDEQDILQMLSRLLERAGYTVFTANDGNEGIKIFESETIDLVITDIIMPDKEGIEVILHLLKKKEDCKIIAVSGGGYLSSHDYLETAREIGAIKTFSKPFNPTEIVRTINEILKNPTVGEVS